MGLLEQHFDVAFAAPDGIKKLRELILTLAMQGKLVPQDPNDEPASELLRSIEIDNRGNNNATKSLPEIDLDDMPYELPKGWKWAYLGEIGQTNIGLTYAPSDVSDTISGTPVLRSNNIQNGKLDLNDLKRVIKDIKENVLVQEGDLLICARNGSKALVGKTAFITGLSEEMAFGAFMAIFRSQFNEYLLYFINSPLFRNMIDEVNTMTINQITQGNLKSTICPLPPLAEQRRIVAKIDQLMARCDELEKLRLDRSQRLLTVHTAALDRLLTAKDSSEFSTAWSFITQHFGELYSVKENVVELRKTILQLAVMGKLVRQDPNDEPASELLRSIELEKQRLVKEGKIKQPETLLAIKPEEIPAQLPNGWRWGKIDTIVRSLRTDIRTGPFGASLHKADHRATGIPVWGIESINKNGSFNGRNKIYVDADKAQELSSFSVQGGDIIISRSGTIGELCQIPKDSPYGLLSTNLMKISLDKQIISPDYFCLLFKGAYSINLQLEELCAGSTRLFLTQSILKKILFPIPPLAEQRRIVEKIDRLMGMCDRLEESIESGKGKQTALLNALMSQV
jgi:type I restriction enzyme, S subunit